MMPCKMYSKGIGIWTSIKTHDIATYSTNQLDKKIN